MITGFLGNGGGGYIASGYTFTSVDSRFDFILFKVSAEGEIEWHEIFVQHRDQYCHAMTAVPEGGYLMVGTNLVDWAAYEVNVIRTDEEGEVIWQNHYGTEMIDIDGNDRGYAITPTEDGNFVIAGETYSPDDEVNYSVLMLEIDIDGELNWMEVIDMDQNERGRAILKTMDGGFVLSGCYSEAGLSGNPLITKTDDGGNLVWLYVEGGVRISANDLHHYNVLAHEDRTFSLIAQTNTGLKGFLQKFGRDPHGVADENNVFLPSWTGLESAYPNPFNSITTFVFTVGSPADVKIDIFNGLGRRQAELVRRSYPIGQHRLSWDAGGLPSADYFARMTAGGVVSTKKVALVK